MHSFVSRNVIVQLVNMPCGWIRS